VVLTMWDWAISTAKVIASPGIFPARP